ncbi:alanine dehydrogenase [Candidatus Entotheonella serta]|nr:alanine dehydrogenase [Candidatus Entotheonella serta]
MQIGIVKEVKDREYRVALTPSGAASLATAGHRVQVQHGAGVEAGFADDAYRQAGAHIVSVEQAWQSELVLKVKEPLASEYTYLNQQILFTYLHLAGVSPALTETLLQRKTTAIAYETVMGDSGDLPLLAPMSAIAGNMAASVGGYYLAYSYGGKGVQLGTILGQPYGKVVVIGDGVVGQHAASTAAGMGARVWIAGMNRDKVADLEQHYPGQVEFFYSQPEAIAAHLTDTDLVVGAVLVRGAKAPHVVTEDMIRHMQPGSVIVDVSIDQGGCIETSRPTTHSDPIFTRHGMIHYCVTNMPGAYPRTATLALTTVTIPYILRLAQDGLSGLSGAPGFSQGLNTYRGYITSEPVAQDLGMIAHYMPLMEALALGEPPVKATPVT